MVSARTCALVSAVLVVCCCGLDVGFVQVGAEAAEINDLPQHEVESNDTLETANALQLVEDPAGSGCFVARGTGEIDPAVSGDYWSDPDFWSFEALAGDVVSIAVETPLSDVNSYVALRNAANTTLSADDNGGPDYDSFVSHYSIATSGTYYAVVGKDWSSTETGGYELRVDVARGIALETDTSYSNDTSSAANWMSLAKGAPGHIVGAAAGTVMSSEGANTDEDHFELGVLSAGSTVTLELPSMLISTLDGRLTLIDSAGASVTDDDGSAADGHFRGTLPADDTYYAKVEANSGEGIIGRYVLDVDVEDPTPPKIAAVAPLPADGGSTDQVVDSLAVTITEDMDSATMNAGTSWDLREAGDDGVFDTGDDVVYILTTLPTYTSGATIGLFIEGGPLPSGHYLFTAKAALTDRTGNLLDGDGNGTGGDPYHHVFDVALPHDLENDDNDSIETATPLVLVEDPAGSGYFIGRGLGSVQPSADNDYWSFEALTGDLISISVDTPDSGLIPYVTLYNASGGYLTADGSNGPDYDSFISRYAIGADGTYYAAVQWEGWSTSTGSYQVRVDLARGIGLEYDRSYNNDLVANANVPALAQGAPGHLISTIAGTVMAPEGANTDEDTFALSTLSAGNVVQLSTRLPSSSTLAPQVRVLDSVGDALTDEDGDPDDGHCRVTIPADGLYYAQLDTAWGYGGHAYVLTDGTAAWADAEAQAQALGGHLATVNDQDEQSWLFATFGSFGYTWIGLTDEAEEGTWVWTSGQAVTYTNWASGEPGNPSSYNWAYIDYYSAGLWYDQHPTWGIRGMIEIEDGFQADAGPGPMAQYILDIDIADLVPPMITSTSPLPADGAVTDQVVDKLTVTVTEDMDAATVNAAEAWDLREAGDDGVFDTGDDVVYILTTLPTYTSGASVGLFIEGGPLPSGYYRFTARATLTDRSANPLDGNADGTGGDPYERFFDVLLPSDRAFEGADNDTRETATPLALVEDPAGSGYFIGRGLGSIQPSTDNDYWSFEALTGDLVAVSVDTPDSGLIPYVTLYNASGAYLTADGSNGPDYDSFISRYAIEADGTYYAAVQWEGWSTSTGSYQVRVDLARGIGLEYDRSYSNDSTSSANAAELAQGDPGHLVATIAGTVMAPEGANTDEDTFALSTLSAGNVVELSIRLPSTSTLAPRVIVMDSGGDALTDEDGDPDDGHCRVTIPADGQYYVQLDTVWGYGGHAYVLTDGTAAWADAEAQAQALGGHLATVNDQDEQDWLFDTFRNLGYTWIGLTDEAEEGTWVWTSGQPPTYTNWAAGEPGNPSSYNWAFIDYYSGGLWYDQYATWAIRGVIEIDDAFQADAAPGPMAQYILDIDIADLVPPMITSTSPLPEDGGSTNQVVDKLTVTVTEDMDAATVNAPAAWDLREAGDDDAFDTADDVVYLLPTSPSYTSGASVGLFVEGGPLPSGKYRFTARTTLTDRSGNPLDGNADGTGGDPYERFFDVLLPSDRAFEGADNDTRETATPLVLVEDPAGSGYFIGRGLGSIQPSTDNDYWSFEALTGDLVAVSVDTPDSGLIPYVTLYNASGAYLTADGSNGPDYDSFISRYAIGADGTYYARVQWEGWSTSTGSYQLRVDLARGIGLEYDRNYSNDSVSNANVPALAQGDPGHLIAAIAGTVMAPEGTNTDEDTFALSTLSTGNVVELSIRLPSSSTLAPRVIVMDSGGDALTDEDGDPDDGHCRVTIPADGLYYGRVDTAWGYGGHAYLLTDGSVPWADAKAQALALGGHLATVNDQDEQDWLFDTFRNFGYTWIGLTDEAEEGTWVWTSGQPVTYTNWAAGEPGTSSSYNWAYIDYYSDGLWYDQYATWGIRGVIELEGGLQADAAPGPMAQYILDIDIADLVPPRITSVSPLPEDGGSTDQVVDQLTVTVTKDLAADTVNTPAAWDLREAGDDDAFETGDDVVYPLTTSPSYTSTTTVGLFIEGGPLPGGHYRFMAKPTLTDRTGNFLDGDGNGTGGDPYHHVFDVALDHDIENTDNDSRETATPLALVEDPAGSGYFIGRGLGSIQPSTDNDYWSFEALEGDLVSVSVDTPDSGLIPYVTLYNASGAYLTADGSNGPDYDSFISRYAIEADGTYYVRVQWEGWSTSTGSYQVRVDLARGIGLEYDRSYSNDSVSGASPVALQTIEDHRTGTIAGTVMSTEGGNIDEDYFDLGEVQPNETIFLSIRLPESSRCRPIVEIRDANNQVITIASNPSEGVARADITSTGSYYAVVVATAGHGPYGQYLLDAAVWPTGALEFADLVASDLAAPAAASSGETISLSWTVGNFGTGATDVAAWHDRLVLSANDRYGDGDDVPLAAVEHTGVLAPEATYHGALDVQLPLAISGSFYVLAQTDAQDAVFEYIFETNNTGQAESLITIAQTPYADLAAAGLSAPAVAVAGSTVTITWSATNEGTGTTGDGTPGGDVTQWDDRIVFSRNAVYGDGDDALIADVSHSGAVSAATSYPGSWTGPVPGELSGDYNVFVFVDASDAVHEHDDQHSNLAGPIAIALNKTLTVQSAPVLGVAIAGDRPGVTDYAAICGANETVGLIAPANATIDGIVCTFVRWLLDGSDQPYGQTGLQVVMVDDHTAVAVYNVPPPVTALATSPAEPNGADGWFIISPPTITLAASGVGVKEIRYRWNDAPETVAAGAWVQFAAPIGVNILHYYAVDQIDQIEAEQTAEIKYDDRRPDIIVESVEVDPGDLMFGDTVDVTWTVRNVGGVPTTTGWTDLVSLSGAGSTCGDTMLTVRASGGALDADGFYVRTASVTLPLRACLAEGEYTIVVTADFTNAQAETDDNNNSTASRALWLTAPPLPDLVVANIMTVSEGFTGQSCSVSWVILNSGAETAFGPWKDSVYISDDDQVGDDDLLGTFSFDGSLATGGSYQKAEQLKLPDQPGQYWIIVLADAYSNVNEQAGEDNNSVVDDDSILVSGYTVTVQTDVEVAPTGTPVPLYGSAAAGNGDPAPNVPLTIRILNSGVRRLIATQTNALGEFAAVFEPLPTEAGHYQVAAAPPAVDEDVVQDEFLLLGMLPVPDEVDIEVVPGTPVAGQVELRNLSNIPLSGIAAQVDNAPISLDVQIQVADGLPGSGATVVDYSVLALDDSVQHSNVQVSLTSAEGVTALLQLNVHVTPLVPELIAIPSSLEAGMLRGAGTIVTFDLLNNGGAATSALDILLPVTPWLNLATSATIAGLAPGETAAVVLHLLPAADLPLGPYTGSIVVVGQSCNVTVPFQFNAISDGLGDLLVTAVDEFTYYAEGSPKVAGAYVTLRDPITADLVAEGTTDENGELLLEDLLEAYYDISITADQHGGFSTTTLVPAAGVRNLTAFLPRQFVSYRWSVVPTEIEDRYTIVVESLFETNVPAPVVTVQPSVIDLNNYMAATSQVNITITNHGLIAAEDVALRFDSHPWFEIIPLTEEIGDLAAMSSVFVPVIINRLNLDPPADGPEVGELTTAESAPCSVPGNVIWSVLCGNQTQNYSQSVTAINANDDCGGLSGIGGSGGGGGGGWPGGWGGPGSPGNPHINPPSISLPYPCDDCNLAIMSCVVGLIGNIPGLDVIGCIGSIIFGVGGTISACSDAPDPAECIEAGATAIVDVAISCGSIVAKPISIAWAVTMCIKGIAEACGDEEEGSPGIACAAAQLQAQELGYDLALIIEHGERLEAIAEGFIEVFGDPIWLSGQEDEAGIFDAWVGAFRDAAGKATEEGSLISEGERAQLLALTFPSQLSTTDVHAFLDRWNRSINYWRAGIFDVADVPPGQSTYFIARDRMQTKWLAAEEAVAANIADGFVGIYDGVYHAEQQMLDEAEEGICAQVRIRIEQEAVITRSAFAATLEIDNAGSASLEQIAVNLDIRDATGQPANDLFGVRPPELTGLTAVDGTGVIEASSTGRALWTLIPTRDAAPDEPTEYFVGGEVIYVIGGTELRIPLFSERILVLPDPRLQLKYFHERDVYSDDPFTEDVTEPPVPFSLALMMSNTGNGTARNVRITSGQPEIIENEKGLLIDFEIIGAQVGLDDVSPSLTVDLGDIEPGKAAVARWLLTASLQGTFVEYSATFEHVDDLGDPRLSLIDSVEIHELFHVVHADQPDDDGLPDFLVDDVPDPDDLPDAIHSSDGTVPAVTAVTVGSTDGPPTPGDLEVQLTASMPAGWAYLRIPEPGGDDYILSRVVRADDSEVPVDNAWMTHRTHRPLGEPAYREHLLHLLDFNGAGSYTLVYEVNVMSTDHTPPQSSVSPLDPEIMSEQFEVRWSGYDEEGGSGLAFHEVHVSINGDPFVPWLLRATGPGAIFTGFQATSYAFYSIAVDYAGNREPAPETPDAQTYIPDMVAPTISLALAAGSDTGAPGDNITNDATPAFTGQTEPLADVTVQITGPGEYGLTDTVQAEISGQWNYTVAGENELPDGLLTIEASATDQEGNVSLENPTLQFTVDTAAPASQVAELPLLVAPVFYVRWSGDDEVGGSGLASFDVYVSENGAPYALLRAGTSDTSALFNGQLGVTYSFYCVARDVAGNVEQKAPLAEAETTVAKQWAVPGDTTMDCTVNILDLIFVRNKLRTDPEADNNWQANVVQDGSINILDLIFVRNNLSRACD